MISLSKMSCSAPIDIPTKKNVNSISGRFTCVYDANMLSSSAVSLSKDLSHLSIKCTSNNNSNVSFYNAGTYIPSEIRIYKPSLHTYNGTTADAEMLIMHSIASSNSKLNVGSDGLIVSVPISMGGNKSSGLNAIIKSANTLNAGTVAMNSSVPISSDVDVNELIPSKPFYVYNGTLPYDSCEGDYYYAVFTDPIFISTTINNVTPSGIKIAPPPALLQKSKTGPGNGIGSTSSDDGTILVEFTNLFSQDDSNNSYDPQLNPPPKVLTTVNVLWGVLIAFVLWVIYWLANWGYKLSKNEEGIGSAVAAVPLNIMNFKPE